MFGHKNIPVLLLLIVFLLAMQGSGYCESQPVTHENPKECECSNAVTDAVVTTGVGTAFVVGGGLEAIGSMLTIMGPVGWVALAVIGVQASGL